MSQDLLSHLEKEKTRVKKDVFYEYNSFILAFQTKTS